MTRTEHKRAPSLSLIDEPSAEAKAPKKMDQCTPRNISKDKSAGESTVQLPCGERGPPLLVRAAQRLRLSFCDCAPPTDLHMRHDERE